MTADQLTMSSTKSWPAHDTATWRTVQDYSTPIDPGRVSSLLAVEWDRFRSTTPASAEHHARAQRSLPLGVPSSFQHWDPHPLAVQSARGAWVTDVDGRSVLDMSMGFGAMLVGHLNPVVVDHVSRMLHETGTLFVTPAPISTEAAERVQRRFHLDLVRFTNSGTEATMYAVRTARAATGRKAIIKIEGGYHGGYDPLTVSVKPALDQAGPADAPISVVQGDTEPGVVYVVPYNDLDRLEQVLRLHASEVAALIMEPVLENLAIIVPDAGYLQGVREACDRHGVLLIFDEVKTGLTAGYGGASERVGVEPDLRTLAKSIGGGLPVAAFGGKANIMQTVVDGRMAHYGTYNGNPLAMAAVIAVDEVCTREALAAAEQRNDRAMSRMDAVICEFELPAHTVGFGVKGAVTWSPTPVRNYRDFKKVDFAMAELSWLWWLNRNILTPPGMDDQWLVSLAHTNEDMDLLVTGIRELAVALRA